MNRMPSDSFIRFEDEAERKEWLPLLVGIYEWESERVAGPWAGRAKSDIRNCTWTKAQMVNHLTKGLGNEFSETSLDSLLERMIAERHLLRIENPEPRFEVGGEGRMEYPREGAVHITRMAEMVRTIGSIHSFPNKTENNSDTHHQLMEGTKWMPRMRKLSPRNIHPDALVSKIQDAFDENHSLSNGSSITDAIEDLKLVLKSMREEFGNLVFSDFQINSIYESILNSWSSQPPSKGLIITAETGAGKTLGFTIPAMVDALIENRMAIENQRKPGLSQLLLYPRNDLAKDQRATLESYLGRLNDNLIDAGREQHVVTLSIDAGGLIKSHTKWVPHVRGKKEIDRIPWGACGPEGTRHNVWNSSNQKYAGMGMGQHGRSANIMIAGIESFRRRLSNINVVSALKENLRRVVLDEIHLSSGIHGAHHSYMLRRLQQVCYEYGSTSRLTFIGASATIAKPKEHTAKIWQCKPNQIRHVGSEEDGSDPEPASIMNHILVRTKKGAAGVGALVDITSAVGHQRRSREISDRPSQYKNLQKMIGFADSHDVVGNWHQLTMENERTSRDAMIDDQASHNETLPYAHWFSRPLEIHPGGRAICDSCSQGRKSENPITINRDDVRKIARKPEDTLEEAHIFEMQHLHIEGDTISVSGLDDCPYLQTGTCWHFSPRTSETEPRPGPNPGYSYRDVLRVKKHTSKSAADENNTDSDANHTFRENPRKGAYPQNRRENENAVPHDIVIATPTLEVGIDMSNVTDVLTHKAIRNISSYRQKIGRGGREIGTDSVAATLMSLRATDFLHYRSTGRLIDRQILEPVPIAVNNQEVMKTEAYMAVFDWLAKENHAIEYVIKASPKGGDMQWGDWGNSIERAVKDLRGRLNSVRTYCKYATGNKLQDIHIDTAIETVSRHLKALLTKYPTNEDPEMRIADLVSWINKADNSDPESVTSKAGPNLKKLNAKAKQALGTLADAEETTPGISKNFEVISKIEEHSRQSEINKIRELQTELGSSMELANKFSEGNSDDLELEMLAFELKSLFLQAKKTCDAEDTAQLHELVEQIKGLEPQQGMTYLFQLLTDCRYFQKDSPYVMIGSLFTNPYESKVVLRNQYGLEESTTAKDALRYYLPGMWTFRAFEDGRCLRVISGMLRGDPVQWVEHYGIDPGTAPSVDELGAMDMETFEKIPQTLRADLYEQSQLPIKMSFREIYLEYQRGWQGSLQRVPLDPSGFVMEYDVRFNGQIMSPGRRPQSYSTTWDIAKLVNDKKEVMTYRVRGMNTDHDIDFSVLQHPLIGRIFSEVNWGEFEVSRIATCVSRSNRNRIRFRHNGRPAVYTDKFVTEGIEFEISSDMQQQIVEYADSWRELPFDTMSLRALRAIIERDAEVDWSLRYAMDSYIECIVELAYSIDTEDCPENKFPSTLGQFMDIISNNTLTADIIRGRAIHGIGDDQQIDIADDITEIQLQFALHASNILDTMSEAIADWMRQTFCNTLSLLLQDAAAAFAGVPGDTISYSFDVDADNKWRIQLYDEDAHGNGAMEVVRDYFQIPIEVRDANEHFAKGTLPTSDFISEIERRLVTCPEHIAQAISIQNHPGSPMIPKELMKEAEQLAREYKKNSWDYCQATTVREAALHNLRRYFIVGIDHDDGFTLDFHRQALELCDSGCPACNGDGMQNAFKGPLSEQYTCRSLLDMVISLGPDIGGYLLKNADDGEIGDLSGKPIDPEIVLVFQPEDGGNGLAKRLVHYPTPPIGLHWIRGGENNNPDWLIRHREAV